MAQACPVGSRDPRLQTKPVLGRQLTFCIPEVGRESSRKNPLGAPQPALVKPGAAVWWTELRGRMGARGPRGGGPVDSASGPGRKLRPHRGAAGASRPEAGFYPAGLSPQHAGPAAGESATIGSIASLPRVGDADWALLSREGSWIRTKLIRVMPSSTSLTQPF